MLEIKSISKHYGSQKAVDDLSFEVSGGTILGFLGPNGAGKSTTMKMVSCYLKPTSGTAAVCGYDIHTHPTDVRKNIGYLPENNPLYLDMYVREYLEFVAGIHRLPKKTAKAKELIDITGLEKEQHKQIGALSKGYKQRVGIAQAMIHDPKVLILDEPTSGLDMNQLVDVRRLIKELGKTKTVILSTHIMQEVEALCNRVIIINNGQLMADDPIEQLQNRIQGESIITLQLVDNQNAMNYLQEITGVNKVKTVNDAIVLHVDGNKDLRPDIFKKIVAENDILLEMKQENLNVENVFQQLTKKNPDA